jgi:hypothetical protein
VRRYLFIVVELKLTVETCVPPAGSVNVVGLYDTVRPIGARAEVLTVTDPEKRLRLVTVTVAAPYGAPFGGIFTVALLIVMLKSSTITERVTGATRVLVRVDVASTVEYFPNTVTV